MTNGTTPPWEMNWQQQPVTAQTATDTPPWEMEWEPTLGERFVRGAAEFTRNIAGDLGAAQQRTTPVVRDASGNFLRPLASDEDQVLFSEQGAVRKGNVVLVDPQDGQPKVFVETPETEASLATSIGRVAAVGALTSPVSRLPGGAAQRAQAAIPSVPPVPAVAQRTRAAAEARQAAQPTAAELVAAFRETGVDPTLGAVTQSRPAQIAENLLTENLASSKFMQNARERSLEQTAAAAADVARRFGAAETPAQGGRAAIRGGKAFVDRFNTRVEGLYKSLGQVMPKDQEFRVPKVADALTGVINRFDNPELGRQFVNPTLQRWQDVIDNAKGVLTWNDIQQFRTEVGQMIRKPVAIGQETVSRKELKRVYAALSKDMFNAAKSVSKEAGRRARRANDFTRGGFTRIGDSLDEILKPGANEVAVFEGLLRTANERGVKASVKKLQRIKRSLTKDEWGEVASSVVHHLGKPPAGARQGGGASDFSAFTFARNFSKLDDGAKDVLFNQAGQAELRKALDRLVQVTEAQRGVERLSNPSGTGRLVSLAGFGTLALADITSAILLGMGSAGAAALITNPKFVNWVVNAPKMATVSGAAAKRGARAVQRGAMALADEARFNRQLARHIAELRQIGIAEPDLAPAINQFADELNERRKEAAGPTRAQSPSRPAQPRGRVPNQ